MNMRWDLYKGECRDNFTDVIFKGILLIFPLLMFTGRIFTELTVQDCLFCLLSVIIAMHLAIKRLKDSDETPWNVSRIELIILAVLLLCVAALVYQMFTGEKECDGLCRYIALLMLMLVVRTNGNKSRHYLKLFIWPVIAVYFFMSVYWFSGGAYCSFVLGMLERPYELIPFLLLGCTVSALLYTTGKARFWRAFYFVVCGAGTVLMFQFGDMLSCCIFALVLLLIPMFYGETLGDIKKNILLIFLYGLAASNVSLIGRIGVGISADYNPVYSIYIDIAIVIIGIVVSGYLDKLPEDSPADTYLPVFHTVYKYIRMGLCAAVILLLIFADGLAELAGSDKSGMFRTFLMNLKNARDSLQGEWWNIMQNLGIIGVLVFGALIVILCIRMYEQYSSDSESDHAWYMLGTLFFVQSMFYPVSSVSMPVLVIYLIFATKSGTAPVHVDESAREVVAGGEDSGEALAEGEPSGEALAVGVTARAVSAEEETARDASAEGSPDVGYVYDDELPEDVREPGYMRFLRVYAKHGLAVVTGALFAVMLILLLILADHGAARYFTDASEETVMDMINERDSENDSDDEQTASSWDELSNLVLLR